MPRKPKKIWEPDQGQWLVCRTDTQIQSQPIDVYFLLQYPSLYCYGFFLVAEIVPEEMDVETLLTKAFQKDGSWPSRVTLPKGDPAEEIFRRILEAKTVNVDIQPTPLIEPYARPFKEEFAEFAFSPSGVIGSNLRDDVHEDDREAAEISIPDSYDPCPCASGKKYKFCCKKIFREVVVAMCAAEDGKPGEAVEAMKKAESIVGKTAEVLCRYSIVYSHFDLKKAEEYLEECLKLFPNYPRVHYIKGVELKEQGKTKEALKAYERAIKNYLPTDKYHLNEVWNNVGTIYYEEGNFEKAKESWEKALLYLPPDRIVKQNLIEFIYTNPKVPERLRKPSPFVSRFMEARKGT